MKDISRILLVTDLDGTLLPSNKILSDGDISAIKKFKKDGGKFTIATGRTIQSTNKYLHTLEIDMPVILYNGSLIYDAGCDKTIYTEFLPKSAYTISQEIFFEMPEVGGEILRMDNIYVVRDNPYEQAHTKICQVEPKYTTLKDVPSGEWFKVLFAMEPALITKLESSLKERAYNDVDFVRSADIFIEMLPKGSSKGKALEEYINRLHLEDYKVIAVGDFHNDIEMLKFADIGIATANAQQDVKDIADIVLERSSDENAIESVINYIYDNLKNWR